MLIPILLAGLTVSVIHQIAMAIKAAALRHTLSTTVANIIVLHHILEEHGIHVTESDYIKAAHEVDGDDNE